VQLLGNYVQRGLISLRGHLVLGNGNYLANLLQKLDGSLRRFLEERNKRLVILKLNGFITENLIFLNDPSIINLLFFNIKNCYKLSKNENKIYK